MLPNKLYFKKLIEIIDKLATISIYDYKSHLKKTIVFLYDHRLYYLFMYFCHYAEKNFVIIYSEYVKTVSFLKP